MPRDTEFIAGLSPSPFQAGWDIWSPHRLGRFPFLEEEKAFITKVLLGHPEAGLHTPQQIIYMGDTSCSTADNKW